ncbi:MAG: DoxX family protein [Bacteroidota bacterium]|nr:DoxX family protein [Bacteroidota bacterium]MDP4260314.1 DoxX family protein [Bacteroidota bacterium]
MSKTNKIIYWISTIWLSLGMFSTGLAQLAKGKAGPAGLDSVTHMGYPVYFLTLLGIWKILGVIALLIPKFPLLKEWAYAGFFFVGSGALFSHIASGDPLGAQFPALLIVMLTVVSWYFRPAGKRIILANQRNEYHEKGFVAHAAGRTA